MKTRPFFRKLTTGAACLLAMIAVSSCKKNTIDPSGQFNIKVVNASPTSGPQSFTLANNILVSGGLKYMDATGYMTVPSGKNMITEFKNEGTNSVYASGSLYTANGVSFTVYLAGSGSSARVKNYEDDLATPNNGQVKIKFIHLSNKAPSTISIKNASGGDFDSSVARDIATGYKYVAPGTLNVDVFGFTSKEKIGSFTFRDLVAGKIYSFYLTDDASGNLVMNKILHN